MDEDVGDAGVGRRQKVDIFSKKKGEYPQLMSQKLVITPEPHKFLRRPALARLRPVVAPIF